MPDLSILVRVNPQGWPLFMKYLALASVSLPYRKFGARKKAKKTSRSAEVRGKNDSSRPQVTTVHKFSGQK